MAIERMMDPPGLIVNLRENITGDERRAQGLAEWFTSKPVALPLPRRQ